MKVRSITINRRIMKSFVGGLGILMMYGWGLIVLVIGILALNSWFGLVGALIGIFIFPVGLIVGLLVTVFTTWLSFLWAVVWAGLIALMIAWGSSE